MLNAKEPEVAMALVTASIHISARTCRPG